MKYVEILVAGAGFHGKEALTYSTRTPLQRGQIVSVPLRNAEVMGVVMTEVSKPDFAVKEIAQMPTWPLLPLQMLDLLFWLKDYYPGPFGTITQLFLPKQIPKTMPLVKKMSSFHSTDRLPPLTADQANALTLVNETGTHLLHGETGTGKTRLYIEMARKRIEQGQSALILTPEIGLTSQLAEDFRKVFGERVVLMHSQLTPVIRQKLWVQLLHQKEPVILIGARSALFSPLRNIGLIVVDEAHETAYKQDSAPYYHASRVASKLAEIHHASLILGTATPLVADYFMAQAKKRPIIRMTHVATESINSSNKRLTVVDLRNRAKFSKHQYLSDVLIAAVRKRLDSGEQSLLFLNRRGTARVVFCDECGWQATCQHCDLPLVYHGDSHTMRCHSCNFKSVSPASCPNCHNASIVFKSIGTKAIVTDIQKLFPNARIMRFDTDNKKNERIEHHYESIKNGDVDILIGTQTLAKGLDLPRLSLVGVIIADTSLYFPDFSAQERTYQLLSQVIGRVGRGHRAGEAIIQTYAPDSPLLKSILERDWNVFYNREIAERQAFTFPPFCYILKLECRRATNDSAEKSALFLAKSLREQKLRIVIDGPAPAFREKAQNKYGWQLVIKAKDRTQLLSIIHNLPSGWTYDIDPLNLL